MGCRKRRKFQLAIAEWLAISSTIPFEFLS